jgi:hypothetical protein
MAIVYTHVTPPGTNPWSREHWNPTKQQRVAAISVQEARRLAAEAGTTLDATDPPPAEI